MSAGHRLVVLEQDGIAHYHETARDGLPDGRLGDEAERLSAREQARRAYR